MNLVKPAIIYDFDDMSLPFFNNYKKDVEIEYGDVYNNSIIHLNHGLKKIHIKKHWSIVYEEFYNYEKKSIVNTLNLINKSNKKSINNIPYLTDNKSIFHNYFDIMNYIYSFLDNCNEKKIILFNYLNVKFVYDIKFYFNNLRIDIVLKSINYIKNFRFFFDKIDNIIVNNTEIYFELEKYLNSIELINKPSIILDIDANINAVIEQNIPIESYKNTNENIFTNNIKKILVK